MRTARVATFGCKVNQHETTLMEDALLEAGYMLVSERDPADLIVVNSCTVTHRADSDARKAVRQALRRNPETFVVMTGCFAQVAPSLAAKQDGIDLVLGNGEKLDLSRYLPLDLSKRETADLQVGAIGEVSTLSLPAAPRSGDRSRAFLKVQEGCHLRCAFCIVPVARGNERSVPLEEVLTAVEGYRAQGYPEVVLTGVHLGGYGRDHGYTLADLVRAIDQQGLVRQRISSLEPMEVNDDFLDAVTASTSVCRHFHLPLQAGSDAVLRRMGRPYTVAQYDQICTRLRAWAPETCIGADIIVGFPGETLEDFQATAEYLADGPIDYAHLFPYSPREGTRAAKMVDQIDAREKGRRMAVLQAIDQRNRQRFAQSNDARVFDCVLEWPTHDSRPETINGVADNYAQCRVATATIEGKPSVARLAMRWEGERLLGRTLP